MVDLSSAAAPTGVRLYAIGDLHGRRDLLERALARIDADLAERPAPDHRIILLGDYVDRGPDSRGVLDILAERRARDGRLICLRGNHDHSFHLFLEGLSYPDAGFWLRWGGVETLASYRVPASEADAYGFERYALLRRLAREAVPVAHREFLAQLAPCARFGDYFFCHAGVRPGLSLEEQDPEDLMWIRDVFLDSPEDHGAIIIHGHTPVPDGPEMFANRIGIDTEAWAFGRLPCLVLEGNVRALLDNDGLRSL